MEIEFAENENVEQNIIDVKPAYDKRANPYYSARKALFQDIWGAGIPVRYFKEILKPQLVNYIKEYEKIVEPERQSKIDLIIANAKAATERKFNHNFAQFLRIGMNGLNFVYFPAQKNNPFTIKYKNQQVTFNLIGNMNVNINIIANSEDGQKQLIMFYTHIDFSVDNISEF